MQHKELYSTVSGLCHRAVKSYILFLVSQLVCHSRHSHIYLPSDGPDMCMFLNYTAAWPLMLHGH